MTAAEQTAAAVVAALRAAQDDGEAVKIRRRVTADEPVIGVRMGTLFDIAKRAARMPMPEIETLMADQIYEPRMVAFCILDFQARRRVGDATLADCYLRHHDAITAWDMVDRAAPRVVGSWVAGTDLGVLRDLAVASDPLRRRTAMTAPLWFISRGSDADLAGGFALARLLHDDPDPLVTNAVGIFCAHAGGRDRAALLDFLDAYGAAMPRPALRLAVRKLGDDRARYLG